MSFEVRWLLTEHEWDELQREQHNPLYADASLPRIDLLDGLIQLEADAQLLFPTALLRKWKERLLDEAEGSHRPISWMLRSLEQGVNVSVIDLAYGLARASRQLQGNQIPMGSAARFSALDSSLAIVFTRTVDGLKVTSNWTEELPEHFIMASESDFHAGVAKFLHDLAVEVHRRAPHALAWEALKDVKTHLNWSPPS
jgi:hypothetical protein